MKKSLILLVTLLLAMTLIFAGCGESAEQGSGEAAQGGQESAQGSGEADIAVISLQNGPVLDWDPSVCFSTDNVVFHNIYEGLLYYDLNTDTFEPRLATEYSVSEDGLTWNFKLREGVKFHDGSDFDASDVKFSIERTRDCNMGASYMWAAVEDIEIVNDYEVNFHLAYPDSIELVAACAYASFIMSAESVPADFDEASEWFNEGNAVGTGPYMLQSQVPGDNVICAQFPEYWRGWDGDHFTHVMFQLTSESSVRRQQLEGGEADVTYDLDFLDYKELQENPNVKVEVNEGLTDRIIFMNGSSFPLENVDLRKALAYCFPYDDVIEHVCLGFATPSTDVIPRTMWGANQETPYHYNLDIAQEHLNAAGYPDGGFTVEYAYSTGNEAAKKIGEMWKAEAAKLGIEITLSPSTWDTNWTRAKSDNLDERPDLIITNQWADLMSPAYAYVPMFHSEDTVNWNLSYYYNPELDAIIDEAVLMTAIDKDRAAELYQQAGQIVAEDCVVVAGGDLNDVMVFSKTFEGFYYNAAYKGVVFFYDCYRAK